MGPLQAPSALLSFRCSRPLDQPPFALLPFRRPRGKRGAKTRLATVGRVVWFLNTGTFLRMAQKPRNRQSCGKPTSEVQLLSSDSPHLHFSMIVDPASRSTCSPCEPWFVWAVAIGELGRLAVSEARPEPTEQLPAPQPCPGPAQLQSWPVVSVLRVTRCARGPCP
jgi:hypothetical protein